MPDSPEGGEKLIRVPIGFPPDVHEWLREQAFRRRTAMAQIVREAVQEHRNRLETQLGLPFDQRQGA